MTPGGGIAVEGGGMAVVGGGIAVEESKGGGRTPTGCGIAVEAETCADDIKTPVGCGIATEALIDGCIMLDGGRIAAGAGSDEGRPPPGLGTTEGAGKDVCRTAGSLDIGVSVDKDG